MNSWVSQTLVECLGWTLVHFVWQGLAIAAVVATALRMMRSASANSRYVAGCLALLLMAFAPVVTFYHLATELFTNSGAKIEIPGALRTDVEPARSTIQTQTVVEIQPARPIRSWAQRMERIFPILVLSWSLGVLALSCRLFGGWLQTHRLR